MLTVGDIRKTIDGLPDEAKVILRADLVSLDEDDVNVDLQQVIVDDGQLRIDIRVRDTIWCDDDDDAEEIEETLEW